MAPFLSFTNLHKNHTHNSLNIVHCQETLYFCTVKKMKVIRIKPFFTALLVFIVGLLWLNNVLFVHFHKLDNNTIIAHAHPFATSTSNNQGGSHQHSSDELVVLNALLLLFTSTIIALVIIKSVSKAVFTVFQYKFFLSLEPLIHSNKAPPQFALAA
jgi:hypothetical protein